MAGSPQGGTTTNASSFSLNEDIKLPMGGRYQPTSSVGVFGGPQHTGMDAASTKNMVGKKMYYDSAGKGTLEYDRERMRSMEAEGIIPQHLLGGGLGGPMPMRRSGGPQTKNGMMMDLNPESPTNGQMIPRGGPQQATPNNAQGFDSFRSNAGLPPPMPEMDRMAGSLRSDYNYRPPSDYRDRGLGRQPTVSQPMAQGGYNVNTASAQGLQQAQQGAAAEMGYRPMAVNSGGYRPSQTSATGYTSAGVGSQGYDAAQSGQAPTLSADQVAGGQIAGTDLQNYMNPYENQVVQQSLNDLERSRLMTQNVGGAQAGAANAFGGDRHGIAEAETNRAFADQAARTASGLRQTGYQNAQQMERQAQMQNQSAGLAGEQQRMAAGSQLGSLSNLGFGMGQTIQGRMDQQGAMQQALNQQLINAGKQQYAGYTGAPAQSLQYLLQAVGGAPASGSATETYDAGLFDYLTAGAQAYATNPLAIGKALGFGA